MEGTYFDNITPQLTPEQLRRVKQNMIDHLRQYYPELYGDLKDEPKQTEK